jgi:hypothetical protein
MDKVKLEFKIPKKQIMEYNGVEFEVNPFMSIAEQAFLINRYLQEYFTKSLGSIVQVSEYDYFEAEFGLKNYILQTNTNIEIEDLNNDFYADADFWEKLTLEIVNYKDFRSKLDFIINEIKEQKVLNSSIGKIVSDLAVKLSDILDKVGNVSPEEIEKLQKASAELIDKLGQSSVLQDVSASPVIEKKEL